MNKNFKKIIKDAKTFSLPENDKKSIMGEVSIFIKENPMSDVSRGVRTPYMKDSIWSSFFILTTFKKNKFILATLIIAFVLSGGTSFAANSSLPGDLLYPVKIHINENIKTFVVFGDNREAEVEIQKADERLREQEALSSKGDVDEETKAQIKANFLKHQEKVKKIIVRVEAKGDVETAIKINSDFENVLKLHSDTASSIGLMESIDNDEADTDDKNDSDSDDRLEVEKEGSLNLNSIEKPTTTLKSTDGDRDDDTDDISDSDKKIIPSVKIDSDSRTDINLGTKTDS